MDLLPNRQVGLAQPKLLPSVLLYMAIVPTVLVFEIVYSLFISYIFLGY